MTTRKIKTCLPSLKPPVPRMLLSNVVYQLTCPGCSASYVGMTTRHIQQRCREHLRNGGTMKAHFGTCTTNSSEISEEKITKILDRSNSLSKLYALEALYISEIKPSLNTKDEYRSRALTLKIYQPLFSMSISYMYLQVLFYVVYIVKFYFCYTMYLFIDCYCQLLLYTLVFGLG